MKLIKYILFNVILMISLNIFAYDIEVDGIYYDINVTEKTASVTNGDVKYEGEIYIPASILYANQELPITKIGYGAFKQNDELYSVTLPSTIISIESTAFYRCKKLQTINIPSSVITLGNEVFHYCENLEKIELPNSINSIGRSTFEDCKQLKQVNIPNQLTKIESLMFYNCI